MRLARLAALALAGLAARSALGVELPGEGYRNHLIIGLGVGVGWLTAPEYDGYVDSVNGSQTLTGAPAHPATALHIPLVATFYGPFWTLLRVGVEADYFFPSETVSGQKVTDNGGLLEIPILLGGHYAFLDNRLLVELGLGPDVAAFVSAGLNGATVQGVELYADPSVGFDSELKGQFFVSSGFSLGLEIGYRSLTSAALHESRGASPLLGPNGRPIHIDFSGPRLVLDLGFVAF